MALVGKKKVELEQVSEDVKMGQRLGAGGNGVGGVRNFVCAGD